MGINEEVECFVWTRKDGCCAARGVTRMPDRLLCELSARAATFKPERLGLPLVFLGLL